MENTQEIGLRNYAHLGDAVWELFVRERTILRNSNVKKLHEDTTRYVKAEHQCKLLHALNEELTEEEQELARRGRNLPIPIGRRSNQCEYRQATAFEVLIGFWYLNDKERLKKIYEIITNFEKF